MNQRNIRMMNHNHSKSQGSPTHINYKRSRSSDFHLRDFILPTKKFHSETIPNDENVNHMNIDIDSHTSDQKNHNYHLNLTLDNKNQSQPFNFNLNFRDSNDDSTMSDDNNNNNNVDSKNTKLLLYRPVDRQAELFEAAYKIYKDISPSIKIPIIIPSEFVSPEFDFLNKMSNNSSSHNNPININMTSSDNAPHFSSSDPFMDESSKLFSSFSLQKYEYEAKPVKPSNPADVQITILDDDYDEEKSRPSKSSNPFDLDDEFYDASCSSHSPSFSFSSTTTSPMPISTSNSFAYLNSVPNSVSSSPSVSFSPSPSSFSDNLNINFHNNNNNNSNDNNNNNNTRSTTPTSHRMKRTIDQIENINEAINNIHFDESYHNKRQTLHFN